MSTPDSTATSNGNVPQARRETRLLETVLIVLGAGVLVLGGFALAGRLASSTTTTVVGPVTAGGINDPVDDGAAR